MDNLTIRKMKNNDSTPWELLLLADPSKEIVNRYLKLGQVYIGLLQNKIIGVYVLVEISPGVKELKNLSVDPEYQNQGVGKQLVSDALNRARLEGAEKIEVGTGNSSLSQLEFYKKCGFKVIGVIKDYFLDNYKEVIMENGIQCKDMIRLAYQLR